MCHSYSAWATGTSSGRLRAGDDDLGVDVEGHGYVLAVVVEVAEVGEVAGVGDGDGLAGFGYVADKFFRRRRSSLVVPEDVGNGHAVDAVRGEPVEDVGETLRFSVLGGEWAGAVAAGDAVADAGSGFVGFEARKCERLAEVFKHCAGAQ